MQNNDYSDFEDYCTFESNTDNLILSKRLLSLYDSDKWDLGKYREKGKGHDDRGKDHRMNADKVR
jgi:hypothetical protein